MTGSKYPYTHLACGRPWPCFYIGAGNCSAEADIDCQWRYDEVGGEEPPGTAGQRSAAFHYWASEFSGRMMSRTPDEWAAAGKVTE